MIKTQFSDSMQGKTEQFAKRQHVATDSSPRKRCSEHNKQNAQRRNGKGGWRCTQHKRHTAEDRAEGRDEHKQRQWRHRHVDGERSQAKVSIAQRSGESPRNQVDNILEMPLLPTLALRLAASLRHREMTVDPRLTDEQRRIARRGERNPQSTIFRQPAVSQVAAHEQTERESHPGAEKLSWQPKQASSQAA